VTREIRIQLLQSGIDTIANLARLTKIERTRLNRALNGDVRLQEDEQQKVADVLGVPAIHVFQQSA
jgi:hypothetical protein